MIVSNFHGKYIAVHNKSFAKLEKYCEDNKIINNDIKKYFSTPIDICPKKCYTFSIGDLKFKMIALYLHIPQPGTDGEEELYFLIKVKGIDRKICFSELRLFCQKENIHDFDVWLEPLTHAKWLVEYTKEEREFFINNFGIPEKYFFGIKNVYVEKGIEYYSSNRRFFAHNEWWTIPSSLNNYYFTNNNHTKLPYNNCRYILDFATAITKEEFEKHMKDKFVFICKNNYDNYYIYINKQGAMNIEYAYINCRNHYHYIPFARFCKFYDKHIVSQFLEQNATYNKLIKNDS